MESREFLIWLMLYEIPLCVVAFIFFIYKVEVEIMQIRKKTDEIKQLLEGKK